MFWNKWLPEITKFAEEQALIEMNSAIVSYENKERILRLTLDFPNKQLKHWENRVIP